MRAMNSCDGANVKEESIVPATYGEFRNWLLRYVDDVWGLPEQMPEDGDIDFAELGMDSLEAHMMASLIEDEYKITFEPMLLLEHPRLNDLAAYCTLSSEE